MTYYAIFFFFTTTMNRGRTVRGRHGTKAKAEPMEAKPKMNGAHAINFFSCMPMIVTLNHFFKLKLN